MGSSGMTIFTSTSIRVSSARGAVGNLDNGGRELFPAGSHQFLGPARTVGLGAARLSRGDSRLPRAVRGAALAGVAEIAGARCVDRRRALGAASGTSRVG